MSRRPKATNKEAQAVISGSVANAFGFLEDSLKDGARLHAFLSGGGLRVVRLEHRKQLLGYGEHFEIETAICHCAEDYLAGGRPYGEVYGEGKLYDHYLTGSRDVSSALDAWILGGRTFDAHWESDARRPGASRGSGAPAFVVELHGHKHGDVPPGIMKRCLAGETVTWAARDFVFESYPIRFANQEPGVSTKTISCPPGRPAHHAHYYRIVRRGMGDKLRDAFKWAMIAESVEDEENEDS